MGKVQPTGVRSNSFRGFVSRDIVWGWAAGWLVLGVAWTSVALPWTSAQEAASEQSTAVPQATPEELGLRLPDAPVLPGGDRRAIINGNDAPFTVARVYLEVGDYYVLLQADGSLISLPAREATLTDRPFVPLDKKALAKQLTEGRFIGFRTRTTRRYLYVYNTSDEFAMATGRILESMYVPLTNYCRRQKLAVEDAEFPLVVIMFRTQDEFIRYRQVPEGLIAYYNPISNHVVMFEQSKLAAVAPELAFKQAVSTIAHEGVHQILHNIGVQKRLSRWPVWFSEGLAEYFAPTELDRRVRWKGVGFVNDLRLYELSEFCRTRANQPPDGQLVRGAVESTSLDSLGYATSWALIHYLSRYDRDAFQACLRDVSQLEPLQSVAPASFYAKHFQRDHVTTEQELLNYLKSLPYVNPILNQTHFVLMIQNGNREVLVTSSPAELRRYQEKHAAGKRFQIQAFPNRAAAELFAQTWLRAQ